MIPILIQHDPAKVIGNCRPDGNGFIFTFLPEAKVTTEMIHASFNPGYVLLDSYYDEKTNEIFVYKMKVFEISIDPLQG